MASAREMWAANIAAKATKVHEVESFVSLSALRDLSSVFTVDLTYANADSS